MEFTVDLNTVVTMVTGAAGVLAILGAVFFSHHALRRDLKEMDTRLTGRIDAIMLFLAAPSSDTRTLLLPTNTRPAGDGS